MTFQESIYHSLYVQGNMEGIIHQVIFSSISFLHFSHHRRMATITNKLKNAIIPRIVKSHPLPTIESNRISKEAQFHQKRDTLKGKKLTSMNQRLRQETPRKRKDIPAEIIHRNPVARFLWHEFGQHGRRHTKNQHAPEPKEEIRNHRRNPVHAFVRAPPVPQQSDRDEECACPGVLSHAVFRAEDQAPAGIDAVGAAGFARHYEVYPGPAGEGGN